jgi:hypothetical protein
VPVYGVVLSAIVAIIITAPALVKVDINGAPVPVAFFAVVSIGVIGLYVAFAIPIYLRWRAGQNFVTGGWTIGKRYKWMAPVAVAEIAITSFIAILPTSAAGAPWYKGFGWTSWKFVNYTPLVVGALLLVLWIAWHLSVKNWFKGPKMTIDLPAGVSAADEIELELHGRSAHGGAATPAVSPRDEEPDPAPA